MSTYNADSRIGVIIADDLTGACDAAVAFSCRKLRTEVVLNWRGAGDSFAEIVAITTESREITAQEAVKELKSAARHLNLDRYSHIFKKIDSVFRGNTFDEIAAAVREFPSDLAIIAPAYPALGRTSMEGILTVRDISGERTFAVRDRLQAAGMRPYSIEAGSTTEGVTKALRMGLREGFRLAYCDAVSTADLHALVRGAKELGVRILWIGSAGLACALAAHLPSNKAAHPFSPTTCPVPTLGTVVMFAGSDHPVTLRQMIALREQTDVVEYAFDESSLGEAKSTFVVIVKRGQTTESDIRKAMQGISPQDVSCLFMTGGDTAMLVCRALGIQSLQLRDEFEPGLPLGVAVGGAFAGSTVILKSGGFGEANVLCRIARAFQAGFQTRNEDMH